MTERFDNLLDAKGRMRIHDGMRYYKKTADQNNMVCSKVVLKDPVDRDALQHAFETTVKRLRVFRLCVDRDERRFFLRENCRPPVVQHDRGQRRTVCSEENNGYMIRVGYCDNTITIDFFHGVSDGMGIIAFQKTLMYYYVSETYGKPETVPPGTILAETPEDPAEYADSLLFVGNEPVTAPKGYEYERAFQIPDPQIGSADSCKLYELKVDAEAFEGYMRKHASSRSAVFAMFMNRVISERNGAPAEPVVAAMAANARAAYGAEKTLQCCVATVPVWYDDDIRAMDWSRQLKCARDMVQAGVAAERILAGALGLRKFNLALEERFKTLEEKQEYARQVNRQGGIKYTYGISYFGEKDYGEEINRRIEENYPILTANTLPIILEIAKWQEHYHISYCTHLEQDPYVTELRDLFLAEGIPCTCEQQEDFVEALAEF